MTDSDWRTGVDDAERIFTKLGPFLLRSRAVVVGRERLRQMRNRLEFVLFARDLGAHSRDKLARLFSCPIVEALSRDQIEKIFGFHNTKVLGFRRGDLSRQALAGLRRRRSADTLAGPSREARGGSSMSRNPSTSPGEPGRKTEAVIAVLGASGIGKHHANWWTLEGGDVRAFLGSSETSVTATAAKLRDLCGFSGRGYTDLEALLEETRPDIVDVCTPPELHFVHVRRALDAGCHVLCEKPFVYDKTLSTEVLLGQARELIERAAAASRRFGICTQYVLSARACFELWRKQRPGARLTSFRGYLVSPIRGRAPDPRRTWVDLSPHMLGALRAIEPAGDIDWGTLRFDFRDHRARVRFRFRRPDGSEVACDIHTDHRDTEPRNVRQMTFNDDCFDIGGYHDEQGVFQSRIEGPGGVECRPDFMRLLIRDFLGGVIDVDGPMALGNLEWMLRVLDATAGKA